MTLFDIFSGGPSDVLANVGNSVLLVTLMSAQDLRRKNKQKMSTKVKVNLWRSPAKSYYRVLLAGLISWELLLKEEKIASQLTTSERDEAIKQIKDVVSREANENWTI